MNKRVYFWLTQLGMIYKRSGPFYCALKELKYRNPGKGILCKRRNTVQGMNL